MWYKTDNKNAMLILYALKFYFISNYNGIINLYDFIIFIYDRLCFKNFRKIALVSLKKK